MATGTDHQAYDYIVVGGGSAGAVIAARLTEDPSCRVLLLEAGPDPSGYDEINTPAMFPTLFKTRWDWNYTTAAQKQLDSRPTYWPRMKALGGCSSMNAMIYIRGNRADFDGWRDGYGAAGWGYDDVLPAFKRSEHNSRLGGTYHGTDGPLFVEDRAFTAPISDAWVDATVGVGLNETDDFNGAEQEGVGRYQVTCHRGRRWSTYDAYLRPHLRRRNLTIETRAFVDRLDFERTRAVGVTYTQGGARTSVRADREVILCGGAVNSPQLLMLSGIGPAAHLAEHGIETIADLSGVGQNLQDHPLVPMIWFTRGHKDLLENATLGGLLAAKVLGRGALTSNFAEVGGFTRSRPDLSAPDLQFHVGPSGFWDNALHEPPAASMTIAPTLVSVASRGEIRLRSADPRWHPEIDPAYYDDQRDLDAMLVGMRLAWEMSKTAPLRDSLTGPFMWELDGNEPTDTELLAYARRLTQTVYHPVGTCAMGTFEGAVVDPDLRVNGVDGLRVADASVMPTVPRGNTNAASIMIGERAADLIAASNTAAKGAA